MRIVITMHSYRMLRQSLSKPSYLLLLALLLTPLGFSSCTPGITPIDKNALVATWGGLTTDTVKFVNGGTSFDTLTNSLSLLCGCQFILHAGASGGDTDVIHGWIVKPADSTNAHDVKFANETKNLKPIHTYSAWFAFYAQDDTGPVLYDTVHAIMVTK